MILAYTNINNNIHMYTNLQEPGSGWGGRLFPRSVKITPRTGQMLVMLKWPLHLRYVLHISRVYMHVFVCAYIYPYIYIHIYGRVNFELAYVGKDVYDLGTNDHMVKRLSGWSGRCI